MMCNVLDKKQLDKKQLFKKNTPIHFLFYVYFIHLGLQESVFGLQIWVDTKLLSRSEY